MSSGEVRPEHTLTPRKLKFEQLRADYELFLQTFETPTWIYRLMQRRHELSPYLLYRNLYYFKDRNTKRKRKQQDKRASFKINDLLQKINVEVEDQSSPENNKHFLNLSFGGFFHGPGFAEEIFLTNEPRVQELFQEDFVKVDIHLCLIYQRKKKGTDFDSIDMIPLGSCNSPWNPQSQMLLPSSSVHLTVPPTAFMENGRAIKTHILVITVSIGVPKKPQRKKGKSLKSESDGDTSYEPPVKRLKTDANNTFNEISARERLQATFSAEMILYDRHKNCLLTDGDYELLLQETKHRSTSSKSTSWENKFKSKLGPFAAFSFGPTIKFKLSWSSKPSAKFAPVYKCLSDPYTESVKPLSNALMNETDTKKELDPVETMPRVFYQFFYNNQTKQQTEAKEGTSCPWCGVKCPRLIVLLKHIKCSHARFSFLYTALKKGHRIDICVNESFEDCLDSGGEKDVGFINIDNAPIKRTPKSEVIVSRACVYKEDIKEFTDAKEVNASAMMKTRERTYYQIRNNRLIPSLAHHDVKSEDEQAPDWLIEKTQNMIEEFTDVNAGEKCLMKYWNTHMLMKGCIADFACAAGCLTFVEEYGDRIIEQNLVRNFLVHLNNLVEFQVIPLTTVVKSMEMLHKMEKRDNDDN